MELPLLHSSELPLPVPAFLCCSPPPLSYKAVEPLFPEHGHERSEKRDGETRVEKALYKYDATIGARPGRRRGGDIRVQGCIEGVQENLHIHRCRLTWVGLQICLHINHEGCTDSREQASLGYAVQQSLPTSVSDGLTKIREVLRSSSYFFV